MTKFDSLDEKLKKVKPKPLSQDEKDMLWSRVESGLGNNEPRFSFSRFFSFFSFNNTRFVFALTLILVLIGGSASTVAASNNSNPGDFLFPVDITAEKILLTITFGDTENELRLRFAEERLDEVKSLLALASSIESSGATSATSTDNGSNTATSTENGSDEDQNNETTATSTNNGTGGTDTSDNNTDSDNSNTEELNDGIDTVENALLYALNQLEESKLVFEAEGNEIGVLAINSFIDELNNLTENHIDKLDKVSVTIKNTGSDDSKIKIQASSKELGAKFNYSEKTDEWGNTKQKVSYKDPTTNKKLEVKENSFNFKFLFNKDKNKKVGNDEEGDEEEEGDDDNDRRSKKKITICHSPQENAQTITIAKKAWETHKAHGDAKGGCEEEEGDNGDDTGTTTPDTIAPVLSGITHSTGTTTATITWNTDEDATSFAAYDTTSGFDPDSVAHVSSSATTTSHELNIEGLTASTTYYYIVRSTDDSGNTASSSEHSFATDALPAEPTSDTTPPVLSSISTSATSTEATINWSTDEPATSKTWYATTTPLVATSSPFVTNNSLVTTHSLPLSGLTASTTYYFIISSSDTSGNTATSSESSFLTLP